MFGLDATEMLVLVIVGIVVVGPKKLPQMMRTAGQWVAKLRKMSSSLRSQSGIDEILRIEGLEKEMRELRALTRLNVMDTLASVGERTIAPRAPRQIGASGGGGDAAPASSKSAPKALPKPATAKELATVEPYAPDSPEPRSAGTADGDAEGPAASSPPAASSSPVVKPPGAPPPGAIARPRPRAPVVMVTLPGETPLLEREWPRDGCDAYDALPDDLEEQEAEAAAAEAAVEAAAAEAAEKSAAEAAEKPKEPAGEAAAAPSDAAEAPKEAPANPAPAAEVT